MTNKNDINSTEKLLNVIRGKQEEAINENKKTTILRQEKFPSLQTGKKLAKIFSDKKIYSIGVDISHDSILLVKTIRSSDHRPILTDQKIINYSEKAVRGSAEFNHLLKAALISFCGNPGNCHIWTMMTAVDVNVHHLKIPRVQKKQLENVIYWSAKKELAFEEKDYIFDYEFQGDIIDQGIPKYSVMVYSAPKAEIERSKALFSNIGITLSGITIAPFAIQNIFRSKWLPVGEGTIATLFIGNQFSRIDIYRKDNLVMTRGIKTGTSSMIEAITESILEKTGTLKLEEGDARKILFNLGSASEKLEGAAANLGLKEDEILKMIIPAIERLVRQIERTLEHYTTSVGHEKIEKLYISSTISTYDPILSYISDQLGLKSEVLDSFKYQITSHIAETISFAERMALVPALGLSLSDNQSTPNLIFTYQDKKRLINIKRINRGIFAASAALLVICIITIIYQGTDIMALNKQKTNLTRELSLLSPLISADKVTKLAADVKMKRRISSQYAERYLGMAIIGEISILTPENIRLINLKIINSRNALIKEKAEKTVKEETDGITLEGIITGNRNMLDSYLTQYMMKLGNSPILRQVSIYKSNIINFKKNDVLQFTMTAKVGK